MLKNQIVILSVRKALWTFGTLVGRTNPEYHVMKYLLEHFYQNEMLKTTPQKIAAQLNLDPKVVNAFMQRLVQSKVLIAKPGIFYLNTDFVLN